VIPHSRPALGDEEARAVTEVIASGQVAQGTRVAAFEAAMAARLGARGAVAVSSGTAALHLALLALGVGPGDEVLFPTFACAAVLQAVRLAGAVPVPVDADPVTFNIDPDAARQARSRHSRALVVVHSFGLPAELDALRALELPVVEDAAQALGAVYRGRPVGTVGEVGVLSFYATKLMTTGEGGLVISSDARILGVARDLREYDQKPDDRPRFNYKMTDLQAAMGLVQARRLPGFLDRRTALAARYRERLAAMPLRLPAALPDRSHVYYRYVLTGPRPAAEYLPGFEARGVAARRPVFRPLHCALGLTGFPGADAAWERAVSLPLYPALTDDDAERVLQAAALAVQ
jgi:perosamine synthetase